MDQDFARQPPVIALVRRFLVCAFLVFASTGRAATDGVIYYNRIATLDTAATLRQINADGTGDQAVPTALPAPVYPTPSRDGRRLLLTSTDPGRPFKISNNVFQQDILTGATGKVTRFEDTLNNGSVILTNGLGQHVGDRQNSSYSINLPYHKAFSPDGTRVVVMNLLRFGTVSSDTPHSNTNGPGQLTAGSGRIPTVDIYRVADGLPEGPYVFLGQERTGFNQGGDGVDWHPTRDEIVATVSSDIPATNHSNLGSIPAGMEGTVLAVFTTTAPYAFVRRLATPSGRSDSFFDLTTLIYSAYSQHDYAPSVSPDGQQVAYVRHTLRRDTRYDGAAIAPLPAVCSIRVINYDGTGDHEVLRMADGLWVTKVAWAPDGSTIAFDLAPQAVINGWNSLLGVVTQSEIYLVQTNGLNPRRLVQAPASFPAWSPAALPRPVVRGIRNGGGMQLEIDQLVPGRPIQIEGSGNLGTNGWSILSNQNASGVKQTITVPPLLPDGGGFYRVRVF